MYLDQPSLSLTYHLRNKIISYLISISDVILKSNCKEAKSLISSNDRLIKSLLELPVVNDGKVSSNLDKNSNENDFDRNGVLDQLGLNNNNLNDVNETDYANNLRKNGQQLIQKINSIDWQSSNQSSLNSIQTISKPLKRKRLNIELPSNKSRKSSSSSNNPSSNNPSSNNPSTSDVCSVDNLDEDIAANRSLDPNSLNVNGSSILDLNNKLSNLNSNLNLNNNLNGNLTNNLAVCLNSNLNEKLNDSQSVNLNGSLNVNPSNLDINLNNLNFNGNCLAIESFNDSGKIQLKIKDLKSFFLGPARFSSPLYLYLNCFDIFIFDLIATPNNTKVSKTPKNIDLFLKCTNVNSGWSCDANVEFSLLNQLSRNKDKKHSFEFNFSSFESHKNGCGLPNFITYKQLTNPQNGFYVNDMFIIEANVSLIKK